MKKTHPSKIRPETEYQDKMYSLYLIHGILDENHQYLKMDENKERDLICRSLENIDEKMFNLFMSTLLEENQNLLIVCKRMKWKNHTGWSEEKTVIANRGWGNNESFETSGKHLNKMLMSFYKRQTNI